ncbi:WD40-repeat-containing domain protein [Pyronema omphalodes]|nr:WD40-repeat-containing domain protein [Pyronema omphalodes]
MISVSSTSRDTVDLQKLQPCSASNDFYIFTQGASVVVVRHDSLALERRFEGHTEEVTVIAVDNSSGTLPTRIVTVDTSKTAIIWSLENGVEISRFVAYDDIQSAAWMKNGNLAFGDSIGNVILFDPIRAESISARTIFNPLVAIAPSGNCKAFALGYNNGSVLIAALSPSFTILHTLTTTSISPSPIVGLAWHASSSKQTSDMLAVQTRDGDLRVWSVPKSIEGDESARVVRVLKRVDGNGKGINWLGWSRNGRIVQYSAGETYIWDVRTKNVEWEYVPTPNNVIGMCIYGPKGALFTLGRDNTVQQFALYPPQLLASFQHAPALPPPSPPASIDEIKNQTTVNHQEIILLLDEEPPHVPQNDYLMAAAPPPPPEPQSMAMAPAPPPMPYQHQHQHQHQLEPTVYADAGLGISNVGMREQRPSSVSSRSSTGSNGSNRERAPSVSSKGSGSTGSGYDVIISSPTSGPSSRKQSLGAASITSVQTASSRKMHPLRQEIHPSPDTPHTNVPHLLPEVSDIFAHLRARLSTVTYESPRQGAPQNRLSDDDLRKEMLFCVFGWRGDIEQLIGDECEFLICMDSVNARSINSLILRMWLGDLDQNSLSVMLGADFNVSGDWLFLALSAMAGQNSWTHVARAYVLKLLQKNDIHMAVLCLLAIGDKNDAVEVYVSHHCYL